MDVQKEREAFETWLFSTEKFKFRNKNFLFMLDEYGSYEDKPVLEHWETWQAAKSQAVPEGFVLVPKEPTDEIIEAMNEFDYRNDYSDMDGAYRTIVETLEKAQEDAEREQKG